MKALLSSWPCRLRMCPFTYSRFTHLWCTSKKAVSVSSKHHIPQHLRLQLTVDQGAIVVTVGIALSCPMIPRRCSSRSTNQKCIWQPGFLRLQFFYLLLGVFSGFFCQLLFWMTQPNSSLMYYVHPHKTQWNLVQESKMAVASSWLHSQGPMVGNVAIVINSYISIVVVVVGMFV